MSYITDISHLAVGGEGSGYVQIVESSHTNISDLYNTDSWNGHGHGHGYGHGHEHDHGHGHDHGHKESGRRSPCVIRCTDILSHIKTCPVCSKLYTPMPTQGSGKWTCEDGSCFKTPGMSGISQKSINIVIALLVVFILLIIRFIMMKKKD